MKRACLVIFNLRRFAGHVPPKEVKVLALANRELADPKCRPRPCPLRGSVSPQWNGSKYRYVRNPWPGANEPRWTAHWISGFGSFAAAEIVDASLLRWWMVVGACIVDAYFQPASHPHAPLF